MLISEKSRELDVPPSGGPGPPAESADAVVPPHVRGRRRPPGIDLFRGFVPQWFPLNIEAGIGSHEDISSDWPFPGFNIPLI